MRGLVLLVNDNHVHKKREGKKSGECHNHKPHPFQTLREEETDKSKQAQIQTNVRKALRLALSSPSEVIALLKGLKNTITK